MKDVFLTPAGADDELSPDESYWSTIMTQFNEDSQGPLFENWEFVRAYVYDLCRKRYMRMIERKKLLTRGTIKRSIDEWNRIVLQRKSHTAVEETGVLFWNAFGEMATEAMGIVIEQKIKEYRVPTVNKLMSDQHKLMDDLKKMCQEAVRQDRERLNKIATEAQQEKLKKRVACRKRSADSDDSAIDKDPSPSRKRFKLAKKSKGGNRSLRQNRASKESKRNHAAIQSRKNAKKLKNRNPKCSNKKDT